MERERKKEREREREKTRKIERWEERERNRAMGENYLELRKKLRKKFEREMGENYSVLGEDTTRFERGMGESYSVMEQTARFKREMGENYSVLWEDTARREKDKKISDLNKLREGYVLKEQRKRFEREMGEKYYVLEKRRFEREMGEKYYVLEKHRERFEREMGEEYSVLEKHRERFEREMGENYSVLEKLNHLMINKACNLTADQIDHIDSFYNRLRFLATILKDLEEKQQQQQRELNYEAKNLAMQIYSVICKTRQLIRSFDVQVPGQRDINNNSDSFFDIVVGKNIMEEIMTIEEKVLQFYEQINQIQLLQDFNDEVHASMSMSMENRTMLDEEITVGFDDEALTIKELLAGGKKQLQMISIVGMPGLGKTTLARKLYNDPYITHYFHIRAWTYASQLPRKTDTLLDILSSVNVVFTDEFKNMTNEKLGEKLYKQLKGKRYLIVIDDLWDIGAWVDLKTYFPNDNNGSRVMFTSRLKELSVHASPDCHPHCLRFLTEEESWELLQRKVFQNESCPLELIKIGKQIMKKCEGLPLAIVIIAGLLAKNIKTQESWKQVAQSVSSYIVSDPNQYMDTLALSYNHLPRHLKPCFLYLGAFPEDQEIPVQKLICLWVAEGFIQKIGQRSLEEVAEDYLMDLVQRSLVIVAQRRFDGRIKACRVHDLLHDLCLKKAREINFVQWIHNYKNASPPSSSNYKTNNQRRLCILSYFVPRLDHIFLQSYSPTIVQSLLCFRNEFEKIIDYDDNLFGDMCLFLCWTFKLLRVLEICYDNAFFPTELTQLVNLRYLAINLKHSCELPPSITNLSNLETLIIISTQWRKVILPCNVWKIPKLKHLYAKGGANYDASLCSEEAVRDHNHPSILENLRTITNLNPCGHVQDLLARTPFLTKLGICGHLLSDSGNLMFLNLEFLRHLETLKLLNKFLYPTNFREVKFPINVKRLTLKYTKIKWEDISILGMLLPNLELLKLDVDAASGWQWATNDGGFPRLKFLKLSLLNVKQWITCSSHFPSLQHLLLDTCVSLKEIPSSLGDILTLQMIEVNYCRLPVVESVWKIKEELESIGNNWLQVLIRKSALDL
ncbi:unnamed protein product [Camellia sinensis]